MAEYIEYHPLKFWLDPASIAEIVAHIQTYLVNNPINSTTEIETIIHDYLIAHPEIIGGVRSINGETGEVVLTADNISAGENVTIKDVLDSLQDQIDNIIDDLNKNVLLITGYTIGGITWTTGANRNSSTQYRSDMVYCPFPYIEFDVPADISFRIAWYKTSSISDWVVSEDLMVNSRSVRKKADYFRFVVTTSDAQLPDQEELESVYVKKARHQFFGLKASFLGDSLTTFKDYSEDSQDGALYAPERYPGLGTGNNVLTVDQTWWMQVLTGLEMQLGAVSAISQTTIVYKDTSGDPPIYPCMSTPERITRLGSNGTPDIVFVFAGTNDCFSGVATVGSFTPEMAISALESANPQTTGVDANLMIRRIQTAYPNALIVGIIPKLTKYLINGGNNTFTADKWYTVCDILMKSYKQCGVNYIIDLREMPLNGSNINDYIFDNVHYNASGMRLMSDYMINLMTR